MAKNVADLTVSLVTNGRNLELLSYAVDAWFRAGASLVVVTADPHTLASLFEDVDAVPLVPVGTGVLAFVQTKRKHVIPHGVPTGPRFAQKLSVSGTTQQLVGVVHDTSPPMLGRARQAGVRAALHMRPEQPLLHTDDDVLPLGSIWPLCATPPDAIQAVRLIGVVGGRWYDWALHSNGVSMLQSYEAKGKGTYITLASQCVGFELLPKLDYGAMGGFRQKQDVKYCWAAEAAGGRLLPPTSHVVLCHLDRP